MYFFIVSSIIVTVFAGPATESYKDQFCTDPRTMKKHAAYTEWADAYSCTRHRCQPGGRNLAIYTVGCKRVEAPESAIECEEVVEDTNMQFPYCCPRLRCLVVVRGEVWTRVLGQPWESLPAAPWSHMYKMKKPPPSDGTFLPKSPEEGPVYELTSDSENRDKVLRTKSTEAPDCNDVAPRAAPVPDIVIALSTNEGKDFKKNENSRSSSPRRKKQHKSNPSPYFEEEQPERRSDNENDDTGVVTEKVPEQPSEERYYGNSYITQKPQSKIHQVAWTEIPQNQWNEHEAAVEAENTPTDNYHQPDFSQHEPEKTEGKQTNLQALVDAIGTRMRDIESVVQRMSQKVHQKPGAEYASSEKRASDSESHKRHKEDKDRGKQKRPGPDGDHYKRFSVRNRGSKYLHSSTDSTTEQPLFVEDSNLNGYYSDASNNLVRRSNIPKEPAVVYTAPVDARRNTPTDSGEDKKHKKHNHKKRKGKTGKSHKKHKARDEKKKRFNRVSSIEMLDRNVVSLEDSSDINL